jgi:hypothetical protein
MQILLAKLVIEQTMSLELEGEDPFHNSVSFFPGAPSGTQADTDPVFFRVYCP